MHSKRNKPTAKSCKAIKILVVDDDDVDREKFVRLLHKSGLVTQIEEASSGRQAIARLEGDHFDCVLVDHRLGDTLGTDLVRSIKEASKYPVPIIMVTGGGDERIAVEAMREGVYDYLTKSHLKSQHLVSAIEGSLRWAELETQLASAQERLKRLSLFDSLTRLPNRNLFFDRLEQTLQSARRSEHGCSLMMMDLNLFKEINDTLGHAAGDMVLAEIGKRLSRLTRAADTFARIGGDEFAALLVGCNSASSAVVVASKIHSALNEPVNVNGELVRVTMSIGVALFPDHGRDSRTLLAHADQAMYRAKRSRNTCEVYSAGAREARPFLIASHLPDALSHGELFLQYQPKVQLGTGVLAGVEALVRWRNPHLGVVSPNDFIPVAERSSLIKSMTYAILDMALDQAVLWRDQGWDVPVAVNLSARMLDDPELTSRVCDALRARGLAHDTLTLEVTETALMTSPAFAQATIRALHDAGVSISIDDFGAGYTSLKYLRDFEISEIKIDRMFVSGLQSESRDVPIVRSIAALAQGFNLRLVAEGIEDEHQLALLHDLGCDYGQGFAIGPPMSAEHFEGWRARDARRTTGRPLPASGTHAVSPRHIHGEPGFAQTSVSAAVR